MKIESAALIGMGAVGAFFAPGLYGTLGPERFTLIAGGERKERLERQGITVNGTYYAFPVCAPEEGSPRDLILIAVKGPALGQALCDIRRFVGEKTQILCLLNGVSSEEEAAAAYGWDHVLYSFMRVSSSMKDGVARYKPGTGAVNFGEAVNDTYSPRVKAIAELFDACGITYRISKDMIGAIWLKYACNVSENLVCALLGIPFGAFRTSSDANGLRLMIMEEVRRVALAKGIDLPQSKLDRQEETLKMLPYGNKPSTLQDLEAGRRTEVEMFAGKMVEMGKETGTDTPLCRLLLKAIRVLEQKNEGAFLQ